MAELLTDQDEKTTGFADADVVHVVDVSDTSQNPAGSSFKVKLINLVKFWFAKISGRDIVNSGDGTITINDYTSSQIEESQPVDATIALDADLSTDHYVLIAFDATWDSLTITHPGSPLDGAIVDFQINEASSVGADINIMGFTVGGGSTVFRAGVYHFRYLEEYAGWFPVGDFPTAPASSILTSSITDGDTTHAPNGNAVFDALAALFTSIGNKIPLAGTDSGSPVTGNIEIATEDFDTVRIFSSENVNGFVNFIEFNNDTPRFSVGSEHADGRTAQFDLTDGLLSILLNGDNAAGIISSDDPDFPGIKYGADYSANYTDRSLVDKEYVDGLLSAPDASEVGNDSLYLNSTGSVADALNVSKSLFYGGGSDPSTSNDSSQGFSNGSRWINQATGVEWEALDVSIGDADWLALNGEYTPTLDNFVNITGASVDAVRYIINGGLCTVVGKVSMSLQFAASPTAVDFTILTGAVFTARSEATGTFVTELYESGIIEAIVGESKVVFKCTPSSSIGSVSFSFTYKII
jgi:hypothetical protein